MKGLTIKPREIAAPTPVIDLMAALKPSLAREASVRSTPPRRRRTRWRPISASRLSCCPSPGVGNGTHRPPPSPPLRPQVGRLPRYWKFESAFLHQRVEQTAIAAFVPDSN